jgi:hypothetical protein
MADRRAAKEHRRAERDWLTPAEVCAELGISRSQLEHSVWQSGHRPETRGHYERRTIDALRAWRAGRPVKTNRRKHAPDEHRCTRCGRSTADGARFSVDGGEVYSMCIACKRVAHRAAMTPERRVEERKRSRRDYYADIEESRRKGREWMREDYRRNPERRRRQNHIQYAKRYIGKIACMSHEAEYVWGAAKRGQMLRRAQCRDIRTRHPEMWRWYIVPVTDGELRAWKNYAQRECLVCHRTYRIYYYGKGTRPVKYIYDDPLAGLREAYLVSGSFRCEDFDRDAATCPRCRKGRHAQG